MYFIITCDGLQSGWREPRGVTETAGQVEVHEIVPTEASGAAISGTYVAPNSERSLSHRYESTTTMPQQ